MTTKLTTILLLVLLASCSTEEESTNAKKPSTIVGTWVRTEQKVGYGGEGTWEKVAQGDTIRLEGDGSFSWSNLDCVPVSYERAGDLIKLTYNCPDSSQYADWPSYSDSINYRVTDFSDSYLTITPATFICTEGCLYKYARVSRPSGEVH